MRTWSKNLACGAFCLISLACGAFCCIKNLARDARFSQKIFFLIMRGCISFDVFYSVYQFIMPVAGPIFGALSTRLIEGFHFEDCLISRFYFVPNPSNLVSQDLLCERSFHTLNRGISFRRIQILLSSFWKRDRENVFYKCSNLGQMFLGRKIFSDKIRNEVKSGGQAIFEMQSLD